MKQNLNGSLMKKYSIIMALSLVPVSCQIELDPIQNSSNTYFEAYTEESDTKTSLDPNKNVLWTSGDEVSIFAGSTANEEWRLKSGEGTTSAVLEKVSSSSFSAGTTISNNVAFYPYNADLSILKEVEHYLIEGIVLPARQSHLDNSFGNKAAPMVAVTSGTEDKTLKFKNVCGVLKLQLTGSKTIKSIEIKANNGEKLRGNATVRVNTTNEDPIITMIGSGNAVTLDCGTGVELSSTAKAFDIVLPPITMENGFTATIMTTDNYVMTISTTKSQTITRSGITTMPSVEFKGAAIAQQPLTFTAVNDATISIEKNGTPSAEISLEYNFNGGEWDEYVVGTSIPMSSGDKVSFRAGSSGNASFSTGMSNYYYFIMTGSISASGNIMSLIDNKLSSTTIPCSCCFRYLFKGCSSLISVPELPATTLKDYCYSGMFYKCSAITIAPKLPATTLAKACYQSLFSNCTSLTQAPELPSVSLPDLCYQSMFSGCTALTQAPELPATTMSSTCYYTMFKGCTSLSIPPSLPAKSLASSCYYGMFENCTSLVKTPALPATSLPKMCYCYMFSGCTSLKETMPAIVAYSQGTSCCSNMFNGCTALTKAPALPSLTLAEDSYMLMFGYCTSLTQAPELSATTLAKSCYSSMFIGCTSLIEAPELPATNLAEGCYAYMFQNCTSLTAAPNLPATALYSYCYREMFSGCTALENAPVLPAETMVNSCYYYMFQNCSKLKYVKMLATDISAYSCIWGWMTGVASSGTFIKNSSATWSVSGVNGIPSGWTVLTE